jgi:chaperonin cofactor prefoldin
VISSPFLCKKILKKQNAKKEKIQRLEKEKSQLEVQLKSIEKYIKEIELNKSKRIKIKKVFIVFC